VQGPSKVHFLLCLSLFSLLCDPFHHLSDPRGSQSPDVPCTLNQGYHALTIHPKISREPRLLSPPSRLPLPFFGITPLPRLMPLFPALKSLSHRHHRRATPLPQSTSMVCIEWIDSVLCLNTKTDHHDACHATKGASL
jgi:hypothetical protein